MTLCRHDTQNALVVLMYVHCDKKRNAHFGSLSVRTTHCVVFCSCTTVNRGRKREKLSLWAVANIFKDKKSTIFTLSREATGSIRAIRSVLFFFFILFSGGGWFVGWSLSPAFVPYYLCVYLLSASSFLCWQ